jgi:ribose transport system permease protein
MKKLLGIFIFLVILYVSILIGTPRDYDILASNHHNLGQRIGLEGILCLGAGLLIITGGIDLSIGSVVSLCACCFCKLVLDEKWPVPIAAIMVVMLGAFVGFINGCLVTYFNVQAFVVTLCGLFIYRGAARWVMTDKIPEIADTIKPITLVFNDSFLYIPLYLWLLLGLFTLATIFLHFTIYGRYFYAIGSNERAAQYSGINTNFYKILAYVLCSMFASLYALMHVVKYNTVQPSTTGNSLELYAIAGAVLGGCSLRGGEGTTLGMLIGTAILRLLPNFTNMWEIPSTLEQTVIGGALLICAILDEQLRRGVGWRDLVAGVRGLWARWFG